MVTDDLHRLMDLVGAEVRGIASAPQRAELAADVERWRDGLHALSEDIRLQLERNPALTEDRCRQHPEHADDTRARAAAWTARATSFRARVERRLAQLEHDVELRRRRRLDEAHRALAGAVYELVVDIENADPAAEQLLVPAELIFELADAYARLEDDLAGHTPALVAVDS